MSRWLPILILLCSSIVAFDYHVNPTGWYTLASVFLPLTLILTTLLLRGLSADAQLQSEHIAWQPFTIGQLMLLSLGVCGLVGVAYIQRTESPIFAVHHTHQFFAWLISMGLVTWGMTGGFPRDVIWQEFRIWIQKRNAHWLLLIILLGFLVRLFDLHGGVTIYVDEGAFARAVTRLRDIPDVKIMTGMDWIASFSWIFAYLQYGFTEIFGATLANLRVISVIFGTLTIPAVYLLGRWAFNTRIGLLAAFLLAVDLPHIHFSRLALNNIADPLFGVLAMALLWCGLQTRSRRMMALAGVCLGMTGYFYEGGRLLYPALIIGWLILHTIIRRFDVPKRGILVFIITTILITSPFYLSKSTLALQAVAPRLSERTVHINYWNEIVASQDIRQIIARYLDERLNPAYLHIVAQPDGSKFYYTQMVGLVLPHVLPFMLMGLGVAVFKWREFGLILPFWILLTILGNSLILWNDWSPRFVVVFPALVILIALGLDVMYRSIASYEKQSRRWDIIAPGLLLLMGLAQLLFYFGIILPTFRDAPHAKLDDQDAAYRAQVLSADTEVYIFHTQDVFRQDVLILQAFEKHDRLVNVMWVNEFGFNGLDPTPDHPYAFFVDPADTVTLYILKRIFGDALMGPEWSLYNVHRMYQFALYQVNGS